MGFFSCHCAFRMLIGWAGKLQSHGRYFRVNTYIPCRGTWGLVLSKRQKKNMTAAFFSFRSSRVLAAASLLLSHTKGALLAPMYLTEMWLCWNVVLFPVSPWKWLPETGSTAMKHFSPSIVNPRKWLCWNVVLFSVSPWKWLPETGSTAMKHFSPSIVNPRKWLFGAHTFYRVFLCWVSPKIWLPFSQMHVITVKKGNNKQCRTSKTMNCINWKLMWVC